MSNIIVMAFSPRNIVGCLLKNRLTKGGGEVTGTPGPPSLRPCTCLPRSVMFVNLKFVNSMKGFSPKYVAFFFVNTKA